MKGRGRKGTLQPIKSKNGPKSVKVKPHKQAERKKKSRKDTQDSQTQHESTSWHSVSVDESELYGMVGGFSGLEVLEDDYDIDVDTGGTARVQLSGQPTAQPIKSETNSEHKSHTSINKNATTKKKSKKNKNKKKKLHDSQPIGKNVKRDSAEAKAADNSNNETANGKRAREEEDVEKCDEVPNEKKVRTEEHASQSEQSSSDNNASFDLTAMSDWAPYGLHPKLLRGLEDLKFYQPMAIQARVLPVALAGKDVMGAAETGSGKTLAFGLPMLQKAIELKESKGGEAKRALMGLVMCPARELALQVKAHLAAAAKYTNVKVAAVVGGMAEQKQTRLLNARPDIVVATPGRLYELMRRGNEHLKDLSEVRFIVLDEADRMLERGCYAELLQILDRLPRRPSRTIQSNDQDSQPLDDKEDGAQAGSVIGRETESSKKKKMKQNKSKAGNHSKDNIKKGNESDASTGSEDGVADGEDQTANENFQWEREPAVEAKCNRQSLVFSATLTFQKDPIQSKKGDKNDGDETLLDVVKHKLHMRDDAVLADLTPDLGVTGGLAESCISCMKEEKDLYLYYLLLRYGGRSLVFVNSIDCLKHITPLLTLLGVQPLALHAKMQQRQRLKNLDKFRASRSSVLVTTDVAARGLDIEGVQHVIHYQLPRTVELYIHRSGRTARAQAGGLSILLLAPDEMSKYRRICHAVGKESGLSSFNVDFNILPAMRKRLTLAQRINTLEHGYSKVKSSNDWFTKTALEMDIELDDGLLVENETVQDSRTREELARARQELAQLLRQPIIVRDMAQHVGAALRLQNLDEKDGPIVAIDGEKSLDDAVHAVHSSKAVSTSLGLKKRRLQQKKKRKN